MYKSFTESCLPPHSNKILIQALKSSITTVYFATFESGADEDMNKKEGRADKVGQIRCNYKCSKKEGPVKVNML